MMTVSSPQSNADASVDIETDTNYLKIAKKGGGHKGKHKVLIGMSWMVNSVVWGVDLWF